jgi:CubicO group peptidase (beta-lactamase class C family)
MPLPKALRLTRKFALAGALTLGILFVSLLLIFSLIYTPEYVVRVLRWGNAGVYDYRKFPERKLETSVHPFHFVQGPDESRVRTLFQTISRMDDLDAFLAANRTQAFIVIQDDRILYEHYFNGSQRDTIVTSFSVAKSFTSALIGVAIAEGYINDVHDPITRYLPELIGRDPRFSNITIRNLLMMASGIKYVEFPFFNGDNAKTYYYPNLRQLGLQHTQIVDLPGKHFLYNNFHPILLGMILERATGTTVANYLQEKIWKPIGMEFSGSWSLDSSVSRFEKMESGINGRAIDFAKFGRLYLKNGNWEGKQVIPASWVAESTREDMSIDSATYYAKKGMFSSPGNQYYKYMWWGIRRSNGQYDFFALGNHGQFIYISPHKNLIIARNGERYGLEAAKWINIFCRFAGAI